MPSRTEDAQRSNRGSWLGPRGKSRGHLRSWGNLDEGGHGPRLTADSSRRAGDVASQLAAGPHRVVLSGDHGPMALDPPVVMRPAPFTTLPSALDRSRRETSLARLEQS